MVEMPDGGLESIEAALGRVEAHLAARARKRRHVADPATALIGRLKAELGPLVDERVAEAWQRRAATEEDGPTPSVAPLSSIPSASAALDSTTNTANDQHGPAVNTMMLLPPPLPTAAARSVAPIEGLTPTKAPRLTAAAGASLLLRPALHIRRPSADALGTAGQSMRGPLSLPLPLPPQPR